MKIRRQWIRTEMDVEFFACVHGASIILVYGFLQWLVHIDSVPFLLIFEMMIVGYVISWTQKLLFIKEKAYIKNERLLREILWCALPVIIIASAGLMLDWFTGLSARICVAFYVIMGLYFIMIWLFIKYFYQEETEEMNKMLKKWNSGKNNGRDV